MMDSFPTMLEAAGGDPSRVELDGLSLLDMVGNGGENPLEWIAWNLRGQRAIRCGDWKLVLDGILRDTDETPPPVWLSKIKEDFSETVNLAEENPGEVEQLRAILDPWSEEQDRLIREQRAEFDTRSG